MAYEAAHRTGLTAPRTAPARPLTIAGLVALGLGLSSTATGAEEFDRAGLLDDGAHFVVALHDAFETQARDCAAVEKTECTYYFDTRARDIRNGAEAYALPLPQGASVDALPDEFHETYAVITSEAADAEPYLTAELQLSYEGWVMAGLASDTGEAEAWHDRWERSLSALSPDTFETGEQLVSFNYGGVQTR
ncbi:hypothetical protein [Pyruvatibacter mobilis]|uniref:hypothetical protein n=1 Tax=Pyruvatibacter mobilis TaxID=1712261 RepID=UPI003BAE3881